GGLRPRHSGGRQSSGLGRAHSRRSSGHGHAGGRRSSGLGSGGGAAASRGRARRSSSRLASCRWALLLALLRAPRPPQRSSIRSPLPSGAAEVGFELEQVGASAEV
ncbi:unnamed protein product, partial [Urochloa humidicola]